MRPGRACRFCGSPSRDNPCWYKAAPFTKRLPPCAGDIEQERQDAIWRSYLVAYIFVAIMTAGALSAYLFR